jgi:hypothetical protein
MFGHPGGIDVWELLPGRGIQSLRGLVGQLGRAAWSHDGRRIAAVSHNWQVAVWDRESNKLLHVFEPPPGKFADNVGLAFSPDGQRLAFSSFRTALLWNLDTGRQVRSWALPIGLVDHLLYQGPEQLLLFRVETEDPEMPPYGTDPGKYPRICRVRNLLDKLSTPIEIKDFNWNVWAAATSRQHNCFVVEGLKVSGKVRERGINAYDATTGKLRWKVPSEKKADASMLHMDPLGDFASVTLNETFQSRMIEVSSGRLLLDRDGGYLDPKAAMRFDFSNTFSVGPRTTIPLFQIGIDFQGGAQVQGFNVAGTHATWTTTDGVVSICDLAAVQERLASIGLGW